ncbi:MAG: protein YgfX [Burkholderiales bacterium]
MDIARSRILGGLLVTIHGVSGGLAVAYLEPIWFGILAALTLSASLVFYLRRDVFLQARQSVVKLRMEEGGRCVLGLYGDKSLPATLLPSSFVSPLLIVLRVKSDTGNGVRAVVLLPDSAPAEELRRLRVWLRCAKSRSKPPDAGQT